MNMIMTTVLQEKKTIEYMLSQYREKLSTLPKGSIAKNRAGNYSGASYDFIFGPVADDDVYTTFTLYTAGVLTKEQTLEGLKIKKLYNQLVLTSEKALAYLNYIGTLPEEEL